MHKNQSDFVTEILETNSEFIIKLKKPGLNYINQLFKLRSADDILKLGIFPDAKEFTESFGIFKAVYKYFAKDYPIDKNYKIFVVGDGKYPRTGVIFAFMTQYEVYSIDPALDLDYERIKDVKRLYLIKDRIENVKEPKPDIIVLPHAHVYLNQIEHLNCNNVVAMPCCYPQDEFKGRAPDIEYDDWNILSPYRTIKIWKKRK